MNDELISKYKLQYNNVSVYKNDSFHDRFIIIDKKELYHFGMSFKDLGKKCFDYSRIDDREILDLILNSLICVDKKI